MLHKDWSGTWAIEERKQRGGGQGGIETTDPQNAYQLVINCLLTFY